MAASALAVVEDPNAVENEPLAVVAAPNAAELWPMFASSHWSPPNPMRPARMACLAGYHMKRAPGPEAGMVPTLVFPVTTNPPSVVSTACPASVVAPCTVVLPLTNTCPSCTEPAANPPLASRCTSVFGSLAGVPFAAPVAAVVCTVPSGNLKPPAVEAITPSAVK